VTVQILRNEHIEVTLLPEKGSDIYRLLDRRTGIDVLFKTPWGLRPAPRAGTAPESAIQWLEAYPGGWQLILPNAGLPSVEHGVEWGFHGEACLLVWDVVAAGPQEAEMEATLFRSPLTVRRRFLLDGPTLRVEEAVTNTSPETIEIMWGHHPAFGAPFLEAGCRMTTGAQTVVADPDQPGSMLAPGSRHEWPHVTCIDGSVLDLSRLPGPEDEPRTHLAYLEDFEAPFFSIVNPRLDLGVGMCWDQSTFDRAWFWQEVHCSSGFPFYKRGYVTAVEPHSTTPGQGGIGAARELGAPLVSLRGGATRSTWIEAMLFQSRTPVASIQSGGRIGPAAS